MGESPDTTQATDVPEQSSSDLVSRFIELIRSCRESRAVVRGGLNFVGEVPAD